MSVQPNPIGDAIAAGATYERAAISGIVVTRVRVVQGPAHDILPDATVQIVEKTNA